MPAPLSLREIRDIARSGGHGRSMLTTGQQPTHTSWWPAESLDPAARAALFAVVCEVRL